MQAGVDPLIEASRRGDRAAFAAIIERHQRAVHAVAYARVRDRALADDIAQDTFVIAWRRLAELRDHRRLPAWLCGIARNLARDVRKHVRRETPGDVEAMHATTPYDELTELESERIVAAALAEVPDIYREPLVLYYYEERSVDDVARSLGITAATTNKRLSRGRRYLAERVAIVERGLARFGPRVGLAASVLAVIGVTLPASHVDASPVVKGSTMHKLAIAAVVTVTATGAGALVVTSTRSAAHAEPKLATREASAKHAAPTAGHGAQHGSLCDQMERHAPSLASLVGGRASAMAADVNDCAAVGKHLAELQADATHGPDQRPDDESLDTCGSQYQSLCETQGWSADRRSCTLAAGDLINAHLCAGQVPASEPPTSVPAELACSVIGPHVASLMQSAGFHQDMTDLPQQLEAGCNIGNWSLELRGCFAAATTIDALKACIHEP